MKIDRTRCTVRQIVRWLWKYYAGCRRQALLNMFVGLMQVGAGLAGVELLRRMIDVATGVRAGHLPVMIGLFAAILGLELLLNAVAAWIRSVLGVRTQNTMQKVFFVRLLRGRWSGVEHLHSGDMLNRLFGDVRDIVGLMTEVLPSAAVVTVQFIASFIYLYSMDSTLAVVLATASPLFIILSRVYFKRMQRVVRRIKDSNSLLQAIMQESLLHRVVVKAFGLESVMAGRLETYQSLLRRQVKTRARLAIFSRTVVSMGFSAGFVVALVWGLFRLQDHLITAGVLMAFLQLIGKMQRPLLDMARLLPSLVNSMASSERLIEIEDLPLEGSAAGSVPVRGAVGISFRNVSFRYAEHGREVLHHFTHDFAPSSFTAVCGQTGAGKTTLVRLMLSLIEPAEGSVTLYSCADTEADTPVSVLTRCNFSYVPQGNTLFSGTIRDNLLLCNTEADDGAVRRALHIAMADFVYDLPGGLDARCGECGEGLSEGQAQRLSIARALIRPCKVLLLDESTSALDIGTERELLSRIKAHLPNVTVIFITHRQAAADFASECLTLEA